MNEKEKDSVMIIKNEKGEEIEVEIVCTFESNDTKKNYIVFTDNTTDESGAFKTYAFTYDVTGKDKTLYPLTSEEEWNTVDAILSKLLESKEQNHE